ncbi:hypothetical protein ACK3SF_03905 [Candidatus Nanosalina sp. VS9-1]|uniref:hypothetical protein n=1 Tax=Candidatus Nanosalina sp. VS9-1 TaxID=3388566 RepID=UPI0039E0A235
MNTGKIDPEALEKFLLEDALDHMIVNEALDLLLLVIGEKPAASTTAHFEKLSPGFEKFVEDFSDEFDLFYVTRDVEDTHPETDENITGSSVFFTDEEERLDMLRPMEQATNKDIGKFLGYPEEAVEAFETSRGFREAYQRFEEMMGDEDVSEEEALDFLEENTSEKSYSEKFDEKVEEMIQDGKMDRSDEKYLGLVSYVPRIEEESILSAVEEARRREKVLKEMDEELDVSVGREYLEKILEA